MWGLLTLVAFVVLERLTQLLPKPVRAGVNVITRYLMFITLPLIFLTPNLDVALDILKGMGSIGNLATGLETVELFMLAKLALLLGLILCLSSEISTQVLLNEAPTHPERSFFGYLPPAWSPSARWALFIGQSPAFFYNQF